MEAARGSTVRAQIARMVTPFVDNHELVAEHVYGIALALFDAKELRPTLAMLMRDGCLGYRLYSVRRMIILARRMQAKNDYQQLPTLLRSQVRHNRTNAFPQKNSRSSFTRAASLPLFAIQKRGLRSPLRNSDGQ